MIVLDASATVKLLTREPGSDAVLDRVASERDRVAPDFHVIEIANALSKKVRYHALPGDVATTALDAISTIVTETADTTALIDHAFALSIEIGHALYDCLYLALALERGCRLLTTDRKFASACGGTRYAAIVETI